MKATVILVTLAAVLLGFVVLVEKPIRQARLREDSRKLFPAFDASEVRCISVRPSAGEEIQIQVTNKSWRVVKPINYPADVVRIAAVLKALGELEWKTRLSADELKDRRNVQEEFGMVAPQLSLGVETTNNKYYLDVGATSAMADEVFLQLRGGDNIYLASADFLKSISADKNDWRDKALVHFEDLQFDGLRITNEAKVVELTFGTKTKLWRLQTPLQARADTPKIDELLKGIAGVKATTFVTDDPKDLEPFGLQPSSTTNFDLAFVRGTNAIFDLRIGLSPTNQTNLVYVQRSDTTNVMLVPKAPLLAWQAAYTNFLDPHMVSVPPPLIDGIQVHGSDNFKLERKADQTWQVVGAETFQADDELVQGMLDTFVGAQIEREKTVVADVAAYGLKPPLAQFTLRSSAIGNPPDYAVAHLEFGTNNTDRVFERSTEEESVNSIGRGEFDRLPRASWQLRDRRVWSFEGKQVTSITIHQEGYLRKLIRDPFGQWTFAPGYSGMIKQDSLEETLNRMGELKAYYWSQRGDANLDRFGFNETDHRVTFEVQNGDRKETYAIAFGKPSEHMHPFATVMREGQRLVFEFPLPIYYEFVRNDLTIPPAFRIRRE
ncbi:MAG: DUF4340 domain-containing protein [Limisphaerales bacterium]